MKHSRARPKTNSASREDSNSVLAPTNLPVQMRLLTQLLTRRFQHVIAPYDITPLHWGILSCLWRQDGLTTRAIVDQLDQLGGTVTVGLDSMEKRKLLRRCVDDNDHRISRIWLTRKGAGLEGKIVPVVRDLISELFSCLSEKEKQDLETLIRRLRMHVEAMDGSS
jgi:DNA-binding MarR family transcriptional regulator